MFDPFMLQLGQLVALRPTLQSLGITQARLDQHYQGVLELYCDRLIDFFTVADTRRFSCWRQLAQQLERRLRTARRVLKTAPSREMVKAILDFPDSGERELQFGERSPQVYLTRRHGCLALVITRGNDAPLTFTLARGLDIEDDATVLPTPAERLAHNVFEEWALGALEGALQRIAWIDPGEFPSLAALDRQLTWASGFADFLEPHVEQDSLRFELEQQLPSWLKNASASGRLAYSQCLEALARFHEKFRGASAQESDAERAQALFGRQMALQLRRLTLECSLRNEANVTHEGYRTVRAAVNTFVVHRRLRGVSMGFMPLLDGSGYLLGPPTNLQGPWLVLRPEAQPVIEQVTLAPNAGAPLGDPFSVLYRVGLSRLLPLFEHPLYTLARLKQVGGNLQGTCEAERGWRCEVSLLRNLAVLLVCPGTEHPGEVPDAHPRIKRMDASWAGARKALSVEQEKRLAELKRPLPLSLGQPISDGVHKGLHRVGNVLIYNKDENHFNVLSNNRFAPVVNFNFVEHQIVDNPEQPTAYGPGLVRDALGRWQLHRAPRLRRDVDQLSPAARRAISAGTALSATVPALLGDATRQSQVPGTLAVEVEEGLERNARHFDDAAQAIQRATSTAPLIAELRGEAGQLRAHGRYLRIEMARHTLTPTLGDVQFLLEQKVIRIQRLAGRVPETIDGVVDYLQEYEVLDLSEGERPLWYAHFHYPSVEAAGDQPKAAHLKTAAQRRLGREYERETGLKVYRGPITNALGRQVFLAV